MHDSSLVTAAQIMTSPYRIMSVNYCNLLCKFFYALPLVRANTTRLGLHLLLVNSFKGGEPLTGFIHVFFSIQVFFLILVTTNT
jgi:hypothetical protein